MTAESKVWEKAFGPVVSKEYGLSVVTYKPLRSFIDVNFHVLVDKKTNNENIKEADVHGYVVKIFNAADSKNPHVIDAQQELMLHVCNNDITSSRPVLSVSSKTHVHIRHPTDGSYRIMTLAPFIPGVLLEETEVTEDHFEIIQNLGRFSGKLNFVMKKFFHPALAEVQNMFKLVNCPKIISHTDTIVDEKIRTLAENVITRFAQDVVPKLDSFSKGAVHNDLNPCNILVKRENPNGEYRVCGVIDYGDSYFGHHLFEVSIIIAHLFISYKWACSDFERTAQLLLKGYCEYVSLSTEELNLIKLCVCARLLMANVFSEIELKKDPGNTYVKRYIRWDLFETIYKSPSWTLSQ